MNKTIVKLKKGDLVNLKNKDLKNPLLRIFYIDENRIYGEVTDKEFKTGVPMVGGFKHRKKYTGRYLAGESEEFDFNLEENLKKKGIDVEKVLGPAISKALNSPDETQVEYARTIIISQIFKR